ncbi:hypothetical protein [Salicibibacter kimchii]|uniref:hypothetical protein n=1 Tax=Salicibibacter kimchii TaxID=2099786 RepID=UPI00135B0C29|nr:hypothetical protein [Salicibibacter kimchii]
MKNTKRKFPVWGNKQEIVEGMETLFNADDIQEVFKRIALAVERMEETEGKGAEEIYR